MRIGIEGLSLLFQRTGTSTYTHALVQSLRRLNLGDQVMLFARNQRLGGNSYHGISCGERLANYFYKEYQLPRKLAERGVDIYHSPRPMRLPKPSPLPCPCVMALPDTRLAPLAAHSPTPARAAVFHCRPRAQLETASPPTTMCG